jgi:hypothetical protein
MLRRGAMRCNRRYAFFVRLLPLCGLMAMALSLS